MQDRKRTIKAIWAVARMDLGMDEDRVRQGLFFRYRYSRMRDCTDAQLDDFLTWLRAVAKDQEERHACTDRQWAAMHRQMQRLHWNLRTLGDFVTSRRILRDTTRGPHEWDGGQTWKVIQVLDKIIQRNEQSGNRHGVH